MSAIAGFFHRAGAPAAERDLERMMVTLKRWGPDGAGAWMRGPVALGQLGLHATPKGLARPAVLDGPRRTSFIAADARLDNPRELGSALGLQASQVEGSGHEELIVGAYQLWGTRCVERLLGDFAFAIWDEERRVLFCARDPIGVRPFYYFCSDRLFAFGTQIKALLALPDVPRRLHEATLGDYLALLPPDKENTFYAGIRRLPPGSAVEVARDSLAVRRYWEPDDSRELRLGSDSEYAEAFKTIFGEAVRSRLQDAAPAGVMLSGGLDSSSIVGIAREIRGPDPALVTLSGTFPSFQGSNGKVDETRFIEMVVSGGGVEPHYVPADDRSPLLDFLWQGEEPVPAASLYMDWAILRAANDLGLKAIISGNDGDSVVGYGRAFLGELAWSLRWMTLLKELKALSRRYRVGRRSILAQWVLPTLVPGPIADARAWFRRDQVPVYDPRSFIRRDFAARVGVTERAREMEREDRPRRREREVHRMNIDSPMLTVLLEVFARVAAEFSLETRYPFLDRRLMEFCLSIPGDQKLRDGWDRVVMRRAMEGLLPPEIRWRDAKQDLNPNFNLKLLESRELLDDIVVRDPEILEPYVDLSALQTAYERFLASPGTGQQGFSVFWAAVFGLWLRHSDISR